MVDTNAVKANLEDWLQNPSWAEYYDNAPSDGCKEFIAMDFYASETEDEDAFRAMDDLESSLSLEDLKYLYENSEGPERARLAQKIRQLQ